MRLRTLLAGLALAGLSSLAMAQEPVLATALDYTLNASRDVPVGCKPGDLQRFPGQTLGQVFGADWPLQPEPSAGGERVRAQLTEVVRRPGAQRGLPAQPGRVVFAVLVDPAGKPLRAEVLCATTEGYDMAAKRLAMRASYRPAVIDGVAVTSVAIHVQNFSGGGT